MIIIIIIIIIVVVVDVIILFLQGWALKFKQGRFPFRKKSGNFVVNFREFLLNNTTLSPGFHGQ